MNGNSTTARDYLVYDRDPEHPHFVVARSLGSISLEAVDAILGPGDRWMRTLDPDGYEWVMEVLDADSGLKTARPDRDGYATRLRRWGDIPAAGHNWNHD